MCSNIESIEEDSLTVTDILYTQGSLSRKLVLLFGSCKFTPRQLPEIFSCYDLCGDTKTAKTTARDIQLL
jgi:hypothetical protein